MTKLPRYRIYLEFHGNPMDFTLIEELTEAGARVGRLRDMPETVQKAFLADSRSFERISWGAEGTSSAAVKPPAAPRS